MNDEVLFTPAGTMTDMDSNTYGAIKIGTQIWIDENLKSTRYNDGTLIPNVTDDTVWDKLTTGAYCCYKNEEKYINMYGLLYNWHAVNTEKLCPAGWRVPDNKDWNTLRNYLGGLCEAGKKMKSVNGWEDWAEGTNSSGFTGLPGGQYYGQNDFRYVGYTGSWWSSTPHEFPLNAWNWELSFNTSCFTDSYKSREGGHSVRCIKDQSKN